MTTSPAEPPPGPPSRPSSQPPSQSPSAHLVGTGLVGGSVGLALRARGWTVTGEDDHPARAARALELGALDAVGPAEPGVEVTFVCTPVSAVAERARAALDAGSVIVTDVGSVKGPIVSAVQHPRFVGGHPMAGSEQEGVDGAHADLFAGATWVLTPDASTDPAVYARLHQVVSSLGADVVAVPAQRHDELVALVSHVPHLTAVTLMSLAAETSEEHATLLRLAAGGFRDMTRIAAGSPSIWPDICADNRDAIVGTLDRVVASLCDVRDMVASGRRDALLRTLERARGARRSLPARAPRPDQLVELRVPVPDRPGALAEVTTLAGELGVNIEDLEIAHSAEGDRGVMILIVDAARSDLLRGGLLARGYRPSAQSLVL